MNTNPLLLCAVGAFLSTSTTAAVAQNKAIGQPAAQFRSAKDLMDLLPKAMVQQLKLPLKADAARRAADDIFLKQAKTKTASFQTKASPWQPWGSGADGADRYSMTTHQTINVGGLNLQFDLWIYFVANQQPMLAKTVVGRDLKVAGELGNVQIVNRAGILALVVNLVHAKIDG